MYVCVYIYIYIYTYIYTSASSRGTPRLLGAVDPRLLVISAKYTAAVSLRARNPYR